MFIEFLAQSSQVANEGLNGIIHLADLIKSYAVHVLALYAPI